MLKFVKKLSKIKPKYSNPSILSIPEQIEFWRRAARKMNWSIGKEEFHSIAAPPRIRDQDRFDGYIDVILSYGFGDNGRGNADPILSGKTAWEYARKHRRGKTWQCQHIHLDNPEYLRLRPDAPARPKGFYFSKIQTGQRFQHLTVSQVLKRLSNDTCFGPEGIQFLTVTHPHFQNLMNERKIPFMALGDYDVAPYGFSDFFDSLQIFCSQDILGLGIGNIDHHYPLFGIPTLRFSHN